MMYKNTMLSFKFHYLYVMKTWLMMQIFLLDRWSILHAYILIDAVLMKSIFITENIQDKQVEWQRWRRTNWWNKLFLK